MPPPALPKRATLPFDGGAWLGCVVEHLDAVPPRSDDLPALLGWIAASLGAHSAACWRGEPGAEAWPLAGTWHDGSAAAQRTLAALPPRHPVPQRHTLATPAWLVLPLVRAGEPLGLMAFIGCRDRRLAQGPWLDQAGRLLAQHLALGAAEEARQEAERRLNTTLDAAAVGIAHVDGHARLIEANRWLCELLQYTRDELIGRSVRELSHPDDVRVTDDIRRRLHDGEIRSFQVEKRYLRRDGSAVWVHLTISVHRDAQGRPLHDIAIFQDISARKRAEEALRVSEQRFRNLVELSSDWYWETDAALRFTTVGSRGRGQELTRQLQGRCPWEIPGLLATADWSALRERLEARASLRDFEYRYADARGRTRHVSVNGEPMLDGDGRFAGYRGVSRDITPRKAYEERVRHLATHDSLTGLPNRAMFSELLNHVLQHAGERRLAVLFIDLDHFKLINDTLGHDAGDELLRTLARRLQECLRSSDLVARLGGDEFVMLVQDVGAPSQVEQVARKALAALTGPVRLLERDYRMTASVGISIHPDDARSEPELMTHADVAMYHAKALGRNNVQRYDASLEQRSRERLALESRLRQAVEREALELHYQPRLDLVSGRVVGVEALLRWHDEELGPVSPASFVPVAEDIGLILPIGRFVLQRACAQAMAWQREGLPAIGMAVNLSPRQLTTPGLTTDITRALAHSGLPPRLLELEVTEGAVMQDLPLALQTLQQLKAMGVRLAVDDFGTGHSSLAQLKRLPIDTLKIDRAFVQDLPDDAEDRAIAEVVLGLGRSLDLTVIAEGVETQAQQDCLARLGCQQIQGYHFSRPLPAAACAALLRRHAG